MCEKVIDGAVRMRAVHAAVSRFGASGGPLRRISILATLLVLGCQQVKRGPDLGDCADYPDGVYTYGEVGIGSCLAGPSDVQFLERQGRTFVGVSNANPYLDFDSETAVDWYVRTRRISETGTLGDPTLASAEKGQAIWRVTIDNLVLRGSYEGATPVLRIEARAWRSELAGGDSDTGGDTAGDTGDRDTDS